MQYQRNYGGADVFATMMGHIQMMARDIAAMEVLGPNPSGTLEWLKQAATKDMMAKGNGDRARRLSMRLDAVYGSLRGGLETPVTGWAASTMAGVRNIITASVLGAASLSSVSDIANAQIRRSFVGIGAKGAFADIVKAMKPSTRREAVDAGLILDNAMSVLHAEARYVGTFGGPLWTQYLADRVLTVSGLTPWTQATRHAFGLAFMNSAAQQASKGWKALPDAFRATFERHGITETNWDIIRRMPQHETADGLKMIRQNEIRERIDPALADRWLEMIQSETEFAVPNSGHRSKTLLLNQNQPGTFLGEVLRSFAQFKSFGVVMFMLHGRTIYDQIAGGKIAGGAAYAGALLIMTTLYGALAAQLKTVTAGRDPQDMSQPAFWGKALLQGGGLGIYGDFLFSNINRFGSGFADTLGGPVVDRATNLWNLTAGNLVQGLQGEDTNFTKEGLRFLRGNIPGGNIFWLRLAWERTVLDQLQWLADPEAHDAFRNAQRNVLKSTGQEFWWQPGQQTPQRAPDLGAAFQ
jgi:hypothetical protein